MVRARRLSVLLLKETVESFDDAFKDAAALKRFDMVPSILDGTLYVRESRKSPPSWLSFIEPWTPRASRTSRQRKQRGCLVGPSSVPNLCDHIWDMGAVCSIHLCMNLTSAFGLHSIASIRIL